MSNPTPRAQAASRGINFRLSEVFLKYRAPLLAVVREEQQFFRVIADAGCVPLVRVG